MSSWRDYKIPHTYKVTFTDGRVEFYFAYDKADAEEKAMKDAIKLHKDWIVLTVEKEQ